MTFLRIISLIGWLSLRKHSQDYILTWVLYGISQQENLTQLLAFKGGTVLKKDKI